MKIYCKYNLFWIKRAKAEVLKLILSSVIAFSTKKFVVTFLWDRTMDFDGTKCQLFLIYVRLIYLRVITQWPCVGGNERVSFKGYRHILPPVENFLLLNCV